MNFELINQIVFIFSFTGLGWMIFRKIPALLELPEVLPSKKTESLTFKLRNKIKELNPFKNFSYEIFLQKVLTKIRILILKIENMTLNWTKGLKEKVQKKKVVESENYWKKIKTISFCSKNTISSKNEKLSKREEI